MKESSSADEDAPESEEELESSSAEGEPSPEDAPEGEEELKPESSEEDAQEPSNAVEGAKRKLDRLDWPSAPIAEVGCPRLVKPRTFCAQASDRESSQDARPHEEEDKPAPTESEKMFQTKAMADMSGAAIKVDSADEEGKIITAEGCSAVTDDLPKPTWWGLEPFNFVQLAGLVQLAVLGF